MPGKLVVLRFTLGPLDTNTYLVYSDENRKAVIIDPADDSPEIDSWIARLDLKLQGLIITHGHFDHFLGAPLMSARYGVPIYMNLEDFTALLDSASWILGENTDVLLDIASSQSLRHINEGYALFGDLDVVVIYTPGHTKGSISLYIPKLGVLFSGDTLFQGTVGRTDMPSGSEHRLRKSLCRLYTVLPLETIVYPGHGPSTTLKYELYYNMFVREALEVC